MATQQELMAQFFANPSLLKTYGGVDGSEYYNPFSGEASSGYQSMFDKGYTLAQDPNIWGSMKEGNFQTDPRQVVKDPVTGMNFYPGQDIGGAWEQRDVKDQGWGNPMTSATILGLSLAATAPFWAPQALGAAGGAAGTEAAATAAGTGAGVNDALGAFLLEAGELPAASAYGQAVLAGTPNWAIPGVSGAGGALGYTGALGTAVNDPLGAWLIEQGYPMDPQYAAEVTAGTPNWAAQPSMWDQAKDLWDKKPSLPSMPGGGMTGDAGGGGEGDGMSLWSDTVSPYGFNPAATGVPNYQAHEATPYGFEDELQRRLALIRGAR